VAPPIVSKGHEIDLNLLAPSVKTINCEGGPQLQNTCPDVEVQEPDEVKLEKQISDLQQKFKNQRPEVAKIKGPPLSQEDSTRDAVFRNLFPVILMLWLMYCTLQIVVDNFFYISLSLSILVFVFGYWKKLSQVSCQAWISVTDHFLVFSHTLFLVLLWLDHWIQKGYLYFYSADERQLRVSKAALKIQKLRMSKDRDLEDPKYQDRLAIKRNFELIDLTDDSDLYQTRFNFMVKCKFSDHEPVLAEIDSASQISLITKDYFDTVIATGVYEILPEPHQTFKGIGSQLVSNMPPLALDFQIGAAKLRGRFNVTDALTSTPVLLGSNIIKQKGLSLIRNTDDGAPIRHFFLNFVL